MNEADTGARTERERIMDVLVDWVGSDETLGAGADAVLAALAEGTDESDPIAQLRRMTALVCSVCQSVEYTDNAYALNRTHCSDCTRKLYALPLVYRPEVQVPAAEMLTTDANQGWIVEYEEGDVWLIKPTLARWLYWNKATAKLAARTLARVGYRVRIVPLLRGTPVEIRGDV